MKAQSQRIKDMGDAVVLARSIGMTTADQIIGPITRFYPNEQITDRLRTHILEIARQIHAPD